MRRRRDAFRCIEKRDGSRADPGLEFASGIPGTIGGAVRMNAGAYNGEIAGVTESVEVMEPDGRCRVYNREEMAFGYRTSIVKTKPCVVLSTVLKLQKGDRSEISATMQELSAKRREKQPLEYPSAGSTFKRPEGYFAGKHLAPALFSSQSQENSAQDHLSGMSYACPFVLLLKSALSAEFHLICHSNVLTSPSAPALRRIRCYFMRIFCR